MRRPQASRLRRRVGSGRRATLARNGSVEALSALRQAGREIGEVLAAAG
ncbi:hypothetical protein [Prauserella endophytica]|nr:hypothetical protein [Prauserella endophytica]